MDRRFGVAFALAAVFTLGACGGSTQSAQTPADQTMTPAEARAFIAQVQKERGTTPETGGVTNMEQLLDVLLHDDLGRFEDAERLVAGKPGIDALTMHATLELSWSDGYSTVANVVEERRKRADADVRRMTEEKNSGRKFTDAEAKELEKLQKDADFDAQAKVALEIIAKDHLNAAGAVVREVLRQFQGDPRTRRVAAFYYLLSEDYSDFDMVIKRLEETETHDAGLQYLRAVESMQRYGIRKDASAFLREALNLNPDMVRAQAKLVLTEDGVEATYAEFQKLKAVAPRHPIVNLAGPAIVSEYETATALSRARESHQLPAGPQQAAPVATPATPPPAMGQ
jgi:hypothetical protein